MPIRLYLISPISMKHIFLGARRDYLTANFKRCVLGSLTDVEPVSRQPGLHAQAIASYRSPGGESESDLRKYKQRRESSRSLLNNKQG